LRNSLAMPLRFPLLSQSTFQILLSSRLLARRTKNPGSARMINEGSGRERDALALAFSSNKCDGERGDHVHLWWQERPETCLYWANTRTQCHSTNRTSLRSFRVSFKTLSFFEECFRSNTISPDKNRISTLETFSRVGESNEFVGSVWTTDNQNGDILV